ncbi:MAG TPA: ATP-binding protein [Anaerolineae bacterium]|nr:ATP-binding protein [Anaerolineae bacterium]
MTFVRTLFELNRDLIVFAYGLAFFLLGLAIAFQSRHSSRLDLARSLTWLAAFGITHGLHEWGDLFIPIQATYLSEPIVQFLRVIQLLLLVISFACLFEFGVTLLRPLGRMRWLHGVPAGLLVAWAFTVFFVVLPLSPDLTDWHHTANGLARYFIGFPGGLAAAYGLRQQTFRRIAPLNVPNIVSTLRVAGVALVLYAAFGGLIPPPLSFFPGSLLNSDTFEQAVGIPPLVFRSLIGLTLAVAIIRGLEVFEVETARTIEAMEQQQILAAEHDRIARDLHDGLIQMVYTAGLLVESAHKAVPPDSPVAGRLDKAITVLNDVIGELRQTLGELRAAPSSLPLPGALQRIAEDPRFRSLVDVSLAIDLPAGDSLSPARTEQVLAVVSEALSNVIRHARARQVQIKAGLEDGRLRVTIRDDGLGLPRQFEAGYGLRNMRERARLLGGQIDVTGVPGKGTTVTLDIPWRDER